MKKTSSILTLIFIVLFFAVSSYFAFFNKSFSFKKGLDISGGAQLIFSIDINAIPKEDIKETLSALRDTIEKRVNLFGVGEPKVYTQFGSLVSDEQDKYRLVVEIPGVVDTNKAVEMIGKTPVLEFRLQKDDVGEFEEKSILTGKHIKKANFIFTQSAPGQFGGEPAVEVIFSKEGAEIFAEVTKDNVGRALGIFLDGELISSPVIKEAIYGGRATISGNFKIEEAKKLVRELNYGALPAPVALKYSQSIGASLGQQILDKLVYAGIVGFVLVSIYMILYYRLFGIVSVFSLAFYVSFMLAIFKLFGITITSAGLVGFILSVGMAVDANVLIFERIKEELSLGKKLINAVNDGFLRAWTSIRDGNLSSLITAIVLFWFGTSIIEGFALVFAIGIIVSMITSVLISRFILVSFSVLFDKK